MPKAGPFVMRWPVKKGDVVLVVFSERALDYILTDGQPQDPQLRRRHALDDAIALPGLLHRGEGSCRVSTAGTCCFCTGTTVRKSY